MGLIESFLLNRTIISFNLPKGFDAESYFDDVIGIIIGSDDKLETIEIEVSNGQQNYFRSLPLHHTQQETSKGEYSSTFTFFFATNFRLYTGTIEVRE